MAAIAVGGLTSAASPTAAACRCVRSDWACSERLASCGRAGERGRAVVQLLSSDAQQRRAGEGHNAIDVLRLSPT
jgi:hypothetical protein